MMPFSTNANCEGIAYRSFKPLTLGAAILDTVVELRGPILRAILWHRQARAAREDRAVHTIMKLKGGNISRNVAHDVFVTFPIGPSCTDLPLIKGKYEPVQP